MSRRPIPRVSPALTVSIVHAHLGVVKPFPLFDLLLLLSKMFGFSEHAPFLRIIR